MDEAKRLELVKALVMDSIANSPENFEMIMSEVPQWGLERELTILEEEILSVLVALVEAKMAKASVILPVEPERTLEPNNIVPELAKAFGQRDCYFYLTSEGKASIKDY